MLVLSVREGEKVILRDGNGTESVVVVVQIRSSKEIKLGFEAPDDIVILREKLIKNQQGEVV
jgi:sRNA-binding carbon storage regulator CsrA